MAANGKRLKAGNRKEGSMNRKGIERSPRMCRCRDCNDVDRIPLRGIDGLLKGDRLSREQAEKVFRRVCDRHRGNDVLTDAELTALEGLCDRLTDMLNSYTVEELDREAAERDPKFPGLKHFYNQVGTMVVWWDRLVDDPAEGDAAPRCGG